MGGVRKLLEVKEEERGETKGPAGRTHNPLDEIMAERCQGVRKLLEVKEEERGETKGPAGRTHRWEKETTRAKRMAEEVPKVAGLLKDQTLAIEQQEIIQGTARAK